MDKKELFELRLTVQKLRLLSHKKQSQTNAKLVASIEVNPSNLAFLWIHLKLTLRD